jgi:hypothetical protein
MSTEPKTCGDCKHYSDSTLSNRGSCLAPVPMAVWEQMHENPGTRRDSDIRDCECFERKDATK